MPCTTSELRIHAEAIAQNTTDEASHRCAVNRLYYSAFHACREFHSALASPGSVGTARGTHEQLIAQLANPTLSPKNPRHAISKALAKALREALNLRVTADYRLHMPMTEAHVKEIAGLAQQIATGTSPEEKEVAQQ